MTAWLWCSGPHGMQLMNVGGANPARSPVFMNPDYRLQDYTALWSRIEGFWQSLHSSHQPHSSSFPEIRVQPVAGHLLPSSTPPQPRASSLPWLGSGGQTDKASAHRPQGRAISWGVQITVDLPINPTTGSTKYLLLFPVKTVQSKIIRARLDYL